MTDDVHSKTIGMPKTPKNAFKAGVNKTASWLCFTVASASFPLLIIGVVGRFSGYGDEDSDYTAEMLFACIVISAATLRILVENKSEGKQAIRNLLFTSTVITIFLPAILFGIMLYSNQTEYTSSIPLVLFIVSLMSGLASVILFENEVK